MDYSFFSTNKSSSLSDSIYPSVSLSTIPKFWSSEVSRDSELSIYPFPFPCHHETRSNRLGKDSYPIPFAMTYHETRSKRLGIHLKLYPFRFPLLERAKRGLHKTRFHIEFNFSKICFFDWTHHELK